MGYFEALSDAMTMLAEDPRTVFVGQGVGVAGTTMTDTLKGVPQDKLLEFPVAEDLQMGFCIGLALEGAIPVCVFPRWNFMLCAANQLVNHLDRLPFMGFSPVVLVRVAAPVTHPFNPGPQHDDDFTEAFRLMLRTVDVVTLTEAEQIVPAYRAALAATRPTILVEHTALYAAKPSGVAA